MEVEVRLYPTEEEAMANEVTTTTMTFQIDCAQATTYTWSGWITASPRQHALYGWVGYKQPDPPTDVEIVAAYEERQRAESACPWSEGILVKGVVVAMTEVRAAWSRELQRRKAASLERERLTVRVQIDDPDEA